MQSLSLLIMAIFLANQAMAGTWAGNQFIYKPSLGARGETEKSIFDQGLDRVDAHLGKYKTLGDPGYSTLSAALATIGSTETTLIIPAETVNITSNTTIPVNVHLLVLRGGKFNISDGATLTINGPFEAGLYQVFSWTGSGQVVFGDGALEWALPEWWGAKGDNSTDCSAAIQAAFKAWWQVRLGKGTYLWNSTSPLYLNSTANGQYQLAGAGVEVTYLKFPNIGASAYCIKVNEDAAGNKVRGFPTIPRLILKDMRIYGNTANYPHLLKVRETGLWLENLYLSDFTDGVVTADYCDAMVVKHIKWANGPPAGYLLRQGSSGDRWLVEGIFVDNYYAGAALHERGIFTGWAASNHIFRSLIGGYFYLNACHNLTIEGWHMESPGNTIPLQINGAVVTVRRSNWWNNRSVVPVVVNDTDSYRRTNLVLEDCTFISYFNNLQARTADIHIQALNGASFLELRNVTSFPQASGHWMAEHCQLGVVATSEVPALNTELTKIKNKRLLTNARIYCRGGNWQVVPLDGLPRYHALTNPSLSWIGAVSTFMSSLAAGTYYYKLAIYYDDSLHTAASSEYSATVGSDGQAVGLATAMRGGGAILRLWRGTQSGSYDRYVDIPLAKVDGGYLHDQGDTLYGFPWITSGVPTPPTANTTMEGVEYANGLRVFYASAAPTSTEFTGVRGDIVWNTAPAAAAAPGWVCVTAGSPGTWKAMANLAN
jgi:hypothetical protein